MESFFRIIILLLVATPMSQSNKVAFQMRNIIINQPPKPHHLKPKSMIVAPIMIKPPRNYQTKVRIHNKFSEMGPMKYYPSTIVDPSYALSNSPQSRALKGQMLFNSAPYNFYFPFGEKSPVTKVTQVRTGPSPKEDTMAQVRKGAAEIKLKMRIDQDAKLNSIQSLMREIGQTIEQIDDRIKQKDNHLNELMKKFERIELGNI